MPRYSVYGLTIACAEPLPGLQGPLPGSATDVTVLIDQVPPWNEEPIIAERYRAVDDVEEERVLVLERPSGFAFRYGDGTAFDIDRGASTIWCRYNPPFILGDAAVYLLGPVLGFALRLRGTLTLHASAIIVEGRAFALAGPAGAGKSTTAAFFAQRGYAVLTDDVLALPRRSDAWEAQRAFDHLRLWARGERAVFGVEGNLPRITPSWEKLALPLAEHRFPFAEAPASLGGVIFLPDDSAPSGPSLRRLDGRAAVLALAGETYTNYLLDAPMRRAELDELTALVASVPVWQATARDDETRGAGLVDAILTEVRRSG